MSDLIDAGTEAPTFELPNQDGETVALDDLDGRAVLYFYPRADTRGCTVEAERFRDVHDRLPDDVTVLGISTDPVEDLAPFHEEYDLPFDLLSDADGAVARAYGTFDVVELGGTEQEIALRNTVVVGPDRRVLRTYESVDPDGHAEQVLADLQD